MNNRKVFQFALTFILIFGGGISAQKDLHSRAEYINKYKDLAVKEMLEYGIPASITLAQGCLETQNGNSPLLLSSNNHFGIKCKSNWTGMTVSHDDDAPGECFRKYSSAEESYRDHSEFLDKSPRYAALFKLDPEDYKGWANGLQQAGYATNPQYAESLIRIIEEYKLNDLDRGKDLALLPERKDPVVIDESVEKINVDSYAVDASGKHVVRKNNGLDYVVVSSTDTYQTIAAEFGMSEARLKKINDLVKGDVIEKGEVLYVQTKHSKAEAGKLLHEVEDGETMRSIAQRYGVKVSRLYRINRLPLNYHLSVGQQLRLR